MLDCAVSFRRSPTSNCRVHRCASRFSLLLVATSGALPRNSLASSATGGASLISRRRKRNQKAARTLWVRDFLSFVVPCLFLPRGIMSGAVLGYSRYTDAFAAVAALWDVYDKDAASFEVRRLCFGLAATGSCDNKQSLRYLMFTLYNVKVYMSRVKIISDLNIR